MFYNLNFSGQGRWQELQVPVLPHPQGINCHGQLNIELYDWVSCPSSNKNLFSLFRPICWRGTRGRSPGPCSTAGNDFNPSNSRVLKSPLSGYWAGSCASRTMMSLCVQGARLASPFHFPKPCDGGRLMQDIVPDAGIGLHLASNTWYNTALACEVNI